MTCRLFPYLAVLAAFVLPATAQVTVDLRFEKTTFLAGEPVPVTVSITNVSGRDLVFKGSVKEPWIDFIVNSTRGVPMPAMGKPAFGAVSIPSGQTLAKKVDLSQIFSFSELGNFSVYAIARLPEQRTGGYQSNRHLFNISTAQPYWSQVVGVPGKRGQTNELRLIQFNSSNKNNLYGQVADSKTGRIIRTHHLGEVLMLRKPSVTVDASLNMHVLYLITPAFWGHARIAPDGNFLGRDLYKSEAGDPVLARMKDGSVKALGGALYDPVKEAEEREKNRKASDRPGFIYE